MFKTCKDLFTTFLIFFQKLVPDFLRTCSFEIYYFMSCSQFIHNVFMTCSKLLNYMSMTCWQLVHVLWRSCSRLLHHHFSQPSYDLFWTCSRLVHITYSEILLNLFMTSSQLVKNISISFSLLSEYSWAWKAASA